jgi:nucleoside-diphosphate-sugar epimerase
MKILFTGASSFTGYWFVKSLAQAGHDLVCTLTGPIDDYKDIRRQRIEQLKPLCRLVPNAAFGTDAFLKIIREDGPWGLLCHHGAHVTDYKNPEFDAVRALQVTTLNLRAILSTPGVIGGVVLTGSVFENDEGAGNEPLRAFSPYGLSKGLTWQMFRFHCGQSQLPLGKFVIPNPFGPFEEPRFTAYLMRNWAEGKTAEVKTPAYLRDNIHVDLLAATYSQFATRVATAKDALMKINPSGYIEKQGEFANRVAREVKSRLGWACELKLARQEDFSEPLERVNTDAVAPMFPAWKESSAWDDFAGFYGSARR